MSAPFDSVKASAAAASSGASTAPGAAPLAVRVRDLQVRFKTGGRTIHAVNGVDLDVAQGEVVSLIGESGSGKSVTLRSLMRLHPPQRTKIEGRIDVCGQDVLAMSERQLSDYRGPVTSMVFQEPLLAFDPVYTVGDQIIEMVRRHRKVSRAQARQRALELFERVRIPSPERRLLAYPHELSGGMRQRVMIALALACEPRVLLADEPTTALDATVQIQILLLLRELQRDLGLAIIFVTHDIGAATEVADRIAVMYGGRIVEQADVRSILREPVHPYTRSLLMSRAAGAMQKGQRLVAIPGSPPDLSSLPVGCAFAPRCPQALPECASTQPAQTEPKPMHLVRCIRANEVLAQPA